MNKDSNRIIGDILEINSDIINQRVESKSPKFIINLKEKRYRKRLDKLIKNIKKQELILNKFNVQELLYYLYTYNEEKYDNIQLIKVINTASDNSNISAEFLIKPDDKDISDIKYSLSVSSRESNMTILIIIHRKEGLVETTTIKRESLYNTSEDSDISYALLTLNNYLLDILEKFLLKYLERFKYNKGYIKEV